MANSEKKENIFQIIKDMEQLPGMADHPAFKKLKQKTAICEHLESLAYKFGEAIDKEVDNDCLQAAIISTNIAMSNVRLLMSINPSAPKQAVEVFELILKEFRSTFHALLDLHMAISIQPDDQSLKTNPELN